MRIDELILRNFRGFATSRLELHPECTVLAGVNGSGKSSLLDGLAVALGSWFLGFEGIPHRNIAAEEVRRERFEREGHWDLEPQYPVRVSARGQISGHTIDWARELGGANDSLPYQQTQQLVSVAEQTSRQVREGRDVDLPVLAYYGTGRLWVQKQAGENGMATLTSRAHGYRDCLDPESNHELFTAWMKHRELALLQRIAKARTEADRASIEDAALDAVARSAARCVEGGERFVFDVAADELRLVMQDGSEQSFGLLSDGYRNLVALAADVAWRAVRLNPHRGRQAPSEASGVVLIDEIELHLHPAWQRTVLGRLREAFPNLQFVVTTHSPQVLASAPAEWVRYLDAEGRIHRVDAAEGLDTNTILRDLMGVAERPPEFADRLAAISDAIDQHRFDEAREQLDGLILVLRPDDPSITALEWELADARSLATEEG